LARLSEAGKDKTLPALLQDRPSIFGSRWIGVAALSVATCVALAVFALQPARDEDQVLAKGAIEVLVTLTRGQNIVATDRAPQQLPALMAGDILQLRVSGGQGRYVELKSEEGDVLFRGLVPATGFLPEALTYTPASVTKLHLRVCATEMTDTSRCPHLQFEL